MKLKSRISIFSCTLCFYLLIVGCEKNPFDYRTKFVGDYRFTVNIDHYGSYPCGPDTNYTDDGQVWYGENKEDLEIILANGLSFAFQVYEDGTIVGCGHGEFETEDKVNYVLSSGGLGGGIIYNIEGLKK